MSGVAIIVIAKSPVPGRVKTRLCPPCTPAEAATIAEAALADTLRNVAATPATARVVALDGAPGPWIPPGFVIVPQLGTGLDERLANAFAAVTGPALLIGMDTPHVRARELNDAADALMEPGVDAVLGPALDGGWWALGLRAADPRVVLGVPMSTATTGAAQRVRLSRLGFHTVTVAARRDVDSFEDARIVAAEAPESRFAAAVRSVSGETRVAG
jgi:glycosyltransferase A (GT-A) superfamily protein (DUF2064 family)